MVLDNMECLLDYDEWIIRTRLVVYPEGSSQHGGRKVMVQSSRTSATRTSQSGEVSSKDDYVRLPWTQVKYDDNHFVALHAFILVKFILLYIYELKI